MKRLTYGRTRRAPPALCLSCVSQSTLSVTGTAVTAAFLRVELEVAVAAVDACITLHIALPCVSYQLLHAALRKRQLNERSASQRTRLSVTCSFTQRRRRRRRSSEETQRERDGEINERHSRCEPRVVIATALSRPERERDTTKKIHNLTSTPGPDAS